MLLLGRNPHVEGSAAPVATPVCHEEAAPEEIATEEPHAVKPVAESLRYTW